MSEVSNGEAKLSAIYAAQYVKSEEDPTPNGDSIACANCGVSVAQLHVAEKQELCPTCWAMLQASIKRAIRCGFRIG